MKAATDRRRSGVRWLALAGAGALLVACAAPPEAAIGPDGALPTADGAAPGGDRTDGADGEARAGSPTALARAALPEPMFNLPDLKELLGTSEDKITALLGRPTFVRNDEPARLMQYRALDCVLDIFLYRNGEDFTVTYTEVRALRVAAIAEPDCLREVVRANIGGAKVN